MDLSGRAFAGEHRPACGTGQGYPVLESDHGDRLRPAALARRQGQLGADKDKEVDHDERLRITGVDPGRYDVKINYRDKRQCLVRNIDIKADSVFSIADKDLTDCTK
jgi:hypothetical protein